MDQPTSNGGTAEVGLGQVLTMLATEDASAPAITCAGETINRMDLERWANRLARGYREAGVAAGSIGAVCLPNSIEFYAACFGLWKVGATPLPLSPQLPDNELNRLVAISDCQVLVSSREAVGAATVVPSAWKVSPDDRPLPPVVPNEWKAIASGGSTGQPKLIVAAQRGSLEALQPWAEAVGLVAGERQLVCAPLYHNAAFVWSMRGLLQGQHLVVLPRFGAADFLSTVEQWKANVALLVPTMMHRILRQMRNDGTAPESLSSLRRIWHMGGPCPEWLKREWIELLGPEKVWELYGTTEGLAAAIIDGVSWLAHPGSVGRAVYGEIRIRDANGVTAKSGVVGEVVMRPQQLDEPTYRYVGAEATIVDGWDVVGDLGWADADGYLYIADRRIDLIISGGANVYPAEVEDPLSSHPSVASCAVIGIPDDELGQRVHALVQLESPATEKELADFLGERLARYKIPRTWEFTDLSIRDEAGKVRRSKLVERASAKHSGQRENHA